MTMTAGLSLDAFKQASKPKKGPRCTIRAIADALDPKDRAALVDALGSEAITGAGIARVLSAAGHEVAAPVVNRHRRGECDCT